MTIDKLIKCLELTSSNQDGECLAAIRKANSIKNKLNVSWGQLFEMKARYERATPEADPDRSNIHRMFDLLERAELSDAAEAFVSGLRQFHSENGFLSKKQWEALFRTYSRFAG